MKSSKRRAETLAEGEERPAKKAPAARGRQPKAAPALASTPKEPTHVNKVEQVWAHRIVGGEDQFLVTWVATPNDSQWLPASGCLNCLQAVNDFLTVNQVELANPFPGAPDDSDSN